MITYCFKNDQTGEIIDRAFPLGKAPKHVRHKGLRYRRDVVAEHSGFVNTPGNWPQTDWACGVHPKQVEEAQKQLIAIGAPGTYDKETGDIVHASRTDRNKFLRKTGRFDRNAGYGDEAGGRNLNERGSAQGW